MDVRQLSPAVLGHQARLVLDLADRRGWSGPQLLFVASVLALGVFRRVVRPRRVFFYDRERAAYRAQLDDRRSGGAYLWR